MLTGLTSLNSTMTKMMQQ